MQERIPLFEHARRWSGEIGHMEDSGRHREFFLRELPEALRDKAAFRSLLQAISDESGYPDVSSATMFASEIVLYRDPKKLFSVRLYLWGPQEYDPVHDHNSWGVIGTALGTLDVINYQRLDDGSDESHAVLQECSRQFIPAGQTYSVYPLNRGIHRTGNAGEPVVIQVGIYGGNITGRPYVNAFDLETGEVSRLYLPHVKKRLLARRALDTM